MEFMAETLKLVRSKSPDLSDHMSILTPKLKVINTSVESDLDSPVAKSTTTIWFSKRSSIACSAYQIHHPDGASEAIK